MRLDLALPTEVSSPTGRSAKGMTAPDGMAASLVAKLFHAAADIDQLSEAEQSWLLERAAHTIGEMRAEITSCRTAADLPPGAIVSSLVCMAGVPETFTRKAVALALLHGAYVIKTMETMVDCKADATERNA